MSTPVGAFTALAVICILLSMVLSAGETAVLRITRSGVLSLTSGGGRRADRVQRLMANRRATAARLAFLRLITEMTTAVSIAFIAANYLDVWWHALVSTAAVTVIVALAVVRLSPRNYGLRNSVAVLRILSGFLTVAVALTAPVARIIVSPGTDSPERLLTSEEIGDLLDRYSKSDHVEGSEGELIKSAYQLRDTLVREVMVPRTAMITIGASTIQRKGLSLFLRSGFSRLPVIGDGVDDVLGTLYFKDLVEHLRSNPGQEEEPVLPLARPAFFVPESKPVDDLLREMQRTATHMALVVDEFGGIAGLVTIEDALEEIVGDLTDEHDRSELQVEDLGNGVFRVPARLPIDELGELFGLEIDDDDVDSAGGLLAKALGKVPLPGSTANALGLHLTADRTEGRRKQLATVLVRLAEDDDAADEAPQ